MKIEKSISKTIIYGIGVFLSGLFSLQGFYEFYNVRVLEETDSYPFGGEGPVPYYYKTAELYSNVNLTYGLIFGVLFALGIWNWKENKKNGLIIFGLTLSLVLIQIFHNVFEYFI